MMNEDIANNTKLPFLEQNLLIEKCDDDDMDLDDDYDGYHIDVDPYDFVGGSEVMCMRSDMIEGLSKIVEFLVIAQIFKS